MGYDLIKDVSPILPFEVIRDLNSISIASNEKKLLSTLCVEVGKTNDDP